MIRNKVIAIDYDGTCTEENSFPKVGKLRDGLKECIDMLQKNGNKVILWTCRTGDSLFEAINYLKSNGIEFDDYNSNIFYSYSKLCRKIVADVYIDDRNLFCNNINWPLIKTYFENWQDDYH